MITRFKIFEKVGDYKNSYYYSIPYNNIHLIKLALERSKLIKSTIIDMIIVELYDMIPEGLVSLNIIFNNDDTFQGFYGIYSHNTMVNFLEFKRKESLKDMGSIKLEDWEVNANKYNV